MAVKTRRRLRAPSPLQLMVMCLTGYFVLRSALTPSRPSWPPESLASGLYEHQLLDEFDDPAVKTYRCDACRAIAHRFDLAFDLAEAAVLAGRKQLDEGEAAEVTAAVCDRRVYTDVTPMIWREQHRLAAKGLETWTRLQRHPESKTNDEVDEEVDWSLRMENHCAFLTGRSGSHSLYTMWLYTSANVAKTFDDFLCYGEGIYADCMRWPGLDEPWPGGDEEVPGLADRGVETAKHIADNEGEGQDGRENDDEEDEIDFLSSESFRLQLGAELERRGHAGSGASPTFRWW